MYNENVCYFIFREWELLKKGNCGWDDWWEGEAGFGFGWLFPFELFCRGRMALVIAAGLQAVLWKTEPL
jgi:hypothetical protein